MTLPRAETKMNAWREPILKAQRRLLNLNANHYTWEERPITLANNHVVNVVIATQHDSQQRRGHKQQDVYKGATTKESELHNRVLVLIHGWGAGLAYYARALPYLVPSFRAVYLLDLPGMAASSRHSFPRRDRDASLEYFLTDLNGAFEGLHSSDTIFSNARRTLGAHSLGAYIATEWVLRAPDMFDQLILISPVGVPKRPENTKTPPLKWRLFKALWKAGVTPQFSLRNMPERVGRRYCTQFIEARFATPGAHADSQIDGEEELDAMTEYCYRVSVAPGASEYAMNTLLTPGAWAVTPLCDRLPLVSVPTAFLYGERDWMDWKAGESASRDMQVPTTVVRVADADHNVFVDNAKGFANAVVKAVIDFDDATSSQVDQH